MLVPIHQLRLHVIISKIISGRGSTEGLEMSFYPQVVIQVIAKLYMFPKGASLSYFLTIWSLQTQRGAHIWPTFDPFNLFSWQIHSSSTPQGIWCCLHGPKEKVTPHSKPPCDVTWPQLCPIGLFGCFCFFSLSMLLKITGILKWLFKLGWFSAWLLPVKTSFILKHTGVFITEICNGIFKCPDRSTV